MVYNKMLESRGQDFGIEGQYWYFALLLSGVNFGFIRQRSSFRSGWVLSYLVVGLERLF